MTELKILYSTSDDCSKITYLYDGGDKVLLPIESDKVLESSQLSYFVKSFFSILKVTKAAFEIYKHTDGIFYTYLCLTTKKESYKINCCPELVLSVLDDYRIPVYTHQKILDTCGIKITDEILNEC